MKLNLIQIIGIIAIFQGLIVAFYFFRLKKGDKVIRVILSSLWIGFALLMFTTLIMITGFYHNIIRFHKAIFFIRQFSFLIGPLIYFFVCRFIGMRMVLQQYLFHLIPFLVSILYYYWHLSRMDTAFILWLSPLKKPNTIIILLHYSIYFLVSIRILKKFQERLKQDKEKNMTVFDKQRRIRMLMIFSGSVMIWVFELYSFIFIDVLNYHKFRPYLAVLYSVCAFVFFKGVVYFVLNKPEFFNKAKKYENSRLTNLEKKVYHEKLISFVTKEKPYLNSLLTLTDLASAIAVPHRDLSQIINEMYQQNFYDFINKFRIDECKKILKESSNEKMTILEAGYSVGFNSKSAFNTAFKKNTGMTPIKYKHKFHSNPHSEH